NGQYWTELTIMGSAVLISEGWAERTMTMKWWRRHAVGGEESPLMGESGRPRGKAQRWLLLQRERASLAACR
ncbi:hypothetical protein BCR44DRAFT_1432124, partial [Catenaria anguillulae PL171]